MDALDWIVRGAGGMFALLTVALGISRATSVVDRDVSPAWWAGFIVVGAIWIASLIADWTFPIQTTVYLANGSKDAQTAYLGDAVVCLPAKSYDDFNWRFGAPAEVRIGANGAPEQETYRIGKGTWLINVAHSTVTIDMFSSASPEIDYDAMAATRPGSIRVNSKYGRPFRMFSQLPLDRIYSPDGDVVERSRSGPCPAPQAAKPGESR